MWTSPPRSCCSTRSAGQPRSTGASLLLATDELDDLVICDRVVVLVRGQVFAEFADPPFDREALIAATEGLASASERASMSNTRRAEPSRRRGPRSAAAGGSRERAPADLPGVREAALLPVLVVLLIVGAIAEQPAS